MCDDIQSDGEKLRKNADLHITHKNKHKDNQLSILEDIRKMMYDIYDNQQIILERINELEESRL